MPIVHLHPITHRPLMRQTNTPHFLSELVVLCGDKVDPALVERWLQTWLAVPGNALDLTKRYTTLLPAETQDWLLNNYPRQYYDGLPDFFKAELQRQLKRYAESEGLDGAPEAMLKLFFSRLGRGGRDRGA